MDATAKIIVTPDPNVQIYSNLTLRKSSPFSIKLDKRFTSEWLKIGLIM